MNLPAKWRSQRRNKTLKKLKNWVKERNSSKRNHHSLVNNLCHLLPHRLLHHHLHQKVQVSCDVPQKEYMYMYLYHSHWGLLDLTPSPPPPTNWILLWNSSFNVHFPLKIPVLAFENPFPLEFPMDHTLQLHGSSHPTLCQDTYFWSGN